MYQVMVVDDEPMAASLIVNIIKRKYSDFGWTARKTERFCNAD